MTALREAAQQALEALDAGVPISPGSILHDWFRATLAQQAEPLKLADPAVQKRLASQWGYVPAAAQAEPVEVAERERVASQWDGCVTHQLDTFGPVDIGASIRAGELVEAQQPEPVEPVAWMVYTLDGKSVCVTDNPADFGEGHRALPLYTAPPQRTYLVKSAQEQEREECAQIADAEASIEGIAQRIAAAIRARGNT